MQSCLQRTLCVNEPREDTGKTEAGGEDEEGRNKDMKARQLQPNGRKYNDCDRVRCFFDDVCVNPKADMTEESLRNVYLRDSCVKDALSAWNCRIDLSRLALRVYEA